MSPLHRRGHPAGLQPQYLGDLLAGDQPLREHDLPELADTTGLPLDFQALFQLLAAKLDDLADQPAEQWPLHFDDRGNLSGQFFAHLAPPGVPRETKFRETCQPSDPETRTGGGVQWGAMGRCAGDGEGGAAFRGRVSEGTGGDGVRGLGGKDGHKNLAFTPFHVK